MPQSEPPGPFIADDEELLPALRPGLRLGKRALAVAGVVLLPLAAVALVRGLSRHERTRSQLPRVAAAQAIPSAHVARESESPVVGAAESAAEATPAPEPPPAVEADPVGVTEPSNARPRTSPATERHASPPVRLAELPPISTVVDRSDGDVNAGTLNVAATPPSNVVLDGRPLGKSPRVVRVSAGPHTLVFIHPLYGRRSLSVNVPAGATTGASAEF